MVDLEKLKILANQLRGVEWAWDDGTLIELDHETPVGVECSIAAGSAVAPFIAAVNPQTVLKLIEEVERERLASTPDPGFVRDFFNE